MTKAMRDRIRELMADPLDDYDRAVSYVLDDFEELERYARSLEKLVSELARQIDEFKIDQSSLQAALREIAEGDLDVVLSMRQIARAALDQSSPPKREKNSDVGPGFRGNNDHT